MSSNMESKKKEKWSFGLVGVTRIETIADGVLAIAMTILVLELSMDQHILDSIAEGHYSAISGEIYGYVMGFLVLGVYWILHHFMLHFIKRSDGVLSWLNILFLMFAALVPLSTKVNSSSDGSYALLFYYITTVVTILILLSMWQYATRGFRLVDKDIDRQNIAFITNSILIGVGIFSIALVGQFFIPELGYLGFVALIYMLAATITGHHIPFSKRRTTSTKG